MLGRIVFLATPAVLVYACAGCRGGCTHKPEPARPAQHVESVTAAQSACSSVYAARPIVIGGIASSGTMADVAVADMDGDGFTDIVVARGNDTSTGNVEVMFGPFDGGPSATWISNAAANYRRLAVADIDHDGYMDIAAAIQAPPASQERIRRVDGGIWHPWDYVYRCDGGLGNGSFPAASATLMAGEGGSLHAAVAIFRNHGSSAPRDFGTAPSQSFSFRTDAGVPIGALSVDFGDYNGDGYADLAVGGGDPNQPITVPVTILVNDTGVLRAQGAWQSSDRVVAYSVRFVDLDGDGLVDLFATTDAPPWGLVFWGERVGSATALRGDALNARSTITYPTCTAVVATDAIPVAQGSLVVGAPNAKDRLCCHLPIDRILALLRTSDATSAVDGIAVPEADLAASARLADVDDDGRVDLLLATWSPVANADCSDGGEPTTAGPIYAVCDVMDAGQALRVGGNAGPTFFAQGMALGDIDHASSTKSSFTPCDGGALTGFAISIPDAHLPTVRDVMVNGRSLSAQQYLAVPGSRLVYIAGGFSCASRPTVSYEYSKSLDLVVADMATSNIYVFMHN